MVKASFQTTSAVDMTTRRCHGLMEKSVTQTAVKVSGGYKVFIYVSFGLEHLVLKCGHLLDSQCKNVMESARHGFMAQRMTMMSCSITTRSFPSFGVMQVRVFFEIHCKL